MATAVRSLLSCRDSQSIAPLTTVPVEPPNRKPRLARRWQARMVSASSTRTTSSTYDSSSSGGRTVMPSPGIIRRPGEYHRAETVHRDNPHRAVPPLEIACATHQCPRGASPDEQHIQLRELA